MTHLPPGQAFLAPLVWWWNVFEAVNKEVDSHLHTNGAWIIALLCWVVFAGCWLLVLAPVLVVAIFAAIVAQLRREKKIP
jgi:hypothetical protein